MRPKLSIKVIDSDTGIELDKVDKLIEPTKFNYGFIGDMMYRTYRWDFAYTITDDYALQLEEKMEKEKIERENETDS